MAPFRAGCLLVFAHGSLISSRICLRLCGLGGLMRLATPGWLGPGFLLCNYPNRKGPLLLGLAGACRGCLQVDKSRAPDGNGNRQYGSCFHGHIHTAVSSGAGMGGCEVGDLA